MNFNNCNFNVAVLGLDNAGKTTTILRLQGDESKPNRAQWGFNTTTAVFKYTKLSKFACISYMKQKKACLTFFDVGGHVKFRKVWPSYYMDVFGCIFVVDVNCKSRFDECKASFQEMAKNPMMKGKPILIIGNKWKKGYLNHNELSNVLGLQSLLNEGSLFCIKLCDIETQEGREILVEGLCPTLKSIGINWLINAITENKASLSKRIKLDMEKEKMKLKESKIAKQKEKESKKVYPVEQMENI